MLITGNLIVNGDTTTISSTVKTIQDNMIELASGNPADTLDTGIYMRYTQDGNFKSSGIYRSASDGRFYFYNYNADVLPGATVDAVSSYYEKAHVSVNNLNADSIDVPGTTKSEITTSTISIFAGKGINNIVDFNTSSFAVLTEPLSSIGSYLRSNIYFQNETTNYKNRTTNFYYEANTGKIAIGQNAIGTSGSIVNLPLWNPNANLHIINTLNAGTSASPAFQIGGTTNPSYSIHTDDNNVYFSSFLNGYDFTFSGTSTMKINRSGSIEFNSSFGDHGQVLVSHGGTSSPVWTNITTADVPESGTNLYYTTQRVEVDIDQYFENKTHVGISYLNGVISNTAPDQTVILREGSNVTITGTYPDLQLILVT